MIIKETEPKEAHSRDDKECDALFIRGDGCDGDPDEELDAKDDTNAGPVNDGPFGEEILCRAFEIAIKVELVREIVLIDKVLAKRIVSVKERKDLIAQREPVDPLKKEWK